MTRELETLRRSASLLIKARDDAETPAQLCAAEYQLEAVRARIHELKQRLVKLEIAARAVRGGRA